MELNREEELLYPDNCKGGHGLKKRMLFATGILLVLFAGTGIWGYNYYYALNPEIERQLEEEFGADFFDVFDLEDIDLSIPSGEGGEEESSQNKDGERKNEAINNGGGDGGDKNSNSESGDPSHEPEKGSDKDKNGDKKPGEEPGDTRITKEAIKEKHIPKINNLESIALDRLDELFKSAYNEYKQKKEDGSLNISELARKYIQAANKLETNVDKAFYDMLDEMEAKLAEHGHSTDIIDQAKREYRSAKSEKRSDFLRKVRN